MEMRDCRPRTPNGTEHSPSPDGHSLQSSEAWTRVDNPVALCGVDLITEPILHIQSDLGLKSPCEGVQLFGPDPGVIAWMHCGEVNDHSGFFSCNVAPGPLRAINRAASYSYELTEKII